MSLKIRLARGGSKKRPHYAIVATDSRMPRDGRFLEKLGTYNPMLAKDDEHRVVMNLDRIKALLATGAQPTDRVARFLEKLGTYNPMLAKDDEHRVVMNLDRIKALLVTGAQPTDRVARFLESAGVLAKNARSNPKTGTPGKAMAERAAKKAARSEAPASE